MQSLPCLLATQIVLQSANSGRTMPSIPILVMSTWAEQAALREDLVELPAGVEKEVEVFEPASFRGQGITYAGRDCAARIADIHVQFFEVSFARDEGVVDVDGEHEIEKVLVRLKPGLGLRA